MDEIIVLGPVDNRYHIGYHIGDKFYSIHQFISKQLAEMTAWRMNSNMQKGIQ